MSLAIAIKDKTDLKIFADTRFIDGNYEAIDGQLKVFPLNNMVIAFAGETKCGQHVMASFKQPRHPRGMDTMAYMMSRFSPALKVFLNSEFPELYSEESKSDKIEFLIAYQGCIFVIDQDFIVTMSPLPFSAIGIKDYALAIMYYARMTGTDTGLSPYIKYCFKTTCHFNKGVSSNYIEFTLKPDGSILVNNTHELRRSNF